MAVDYVVTINDVQIELSLQKGADGLTPYIGENGHWWIGLTDTGTYAEGNGIVSVEFVEKVGLISTYQINFLRGNPFVFYVTDGEKGDTGTTAYEAAIAGGFVGTESEFNTYLSEVGNKINVTAIKQTTGTSTTDIMSQNATSEAIFQQFKETAFQGAVNVYYRYVGSSYILSLTAPTGTENAPFALTGTNTTSHTFSGQIGRAGFYSPKSTYSKSLYLTGLVQNTTYTLVMSYKIKTQQIYSVQGSFTTASGQTSYLFSMQIPNSLVYQSEIQYLSTDIFEESFAITKNTAPNGTIYLTSNPSLGQVSTMIRYGGVIYGTDVYIESVGKTLDAFATEQYVTNEELSRGAIIDGSTFSTVAQMCSAITQDGFYNVFANLNEDNNPFFASQIGVEDKQLYQISAYYNNTEERWYYDISAYGMTAAPTDSNQYYMSATYASAEGFISSIWGKTITNSDIVQTTGASTTKIMSQKATTDAIDTAIQSAIYDSWTSSY